MPYYETLKFEDSQFSSVEGSVSHSGPTLHRVSRDRSWRTKVPQGDLVTLVPKNVAEPYSWFIDNEKLKMRNLTASGFDTSALTVDRGHTWENEVWENVKPGLDFSARVGTSPLYTYRGLHLGVGAVSDPAPFTFKTPTSELESWAATMYGRMAPGVSEFSLTNFPW